MYQYIFKVKVKKSNLILQIDTYDRRNHDE